MGWRGPGAPAREPGRPGADRSEPAGRDRRRRHIAPRAGRCRSSTSSPARTSPTSTPGRPHRPDRRFGSGQRHLAELGDWLASARTAEQLEETSMSANTPSHPDRPSRFPLIAPARLDDYVAFVTAERAASAPRSAAASRAGRDRRSRLLARRGTRQRAAGPAARHGVDASIHQGNVGLGTIVAAPSLT